MAEIIEINPSMSTRTPGDVWKEEHERHLFGLLSPGGGGGGEEDEYVQLPQRRHVSRPV